MALPLFITGIRITSSTLWSFAFSAAAHSVVIGSIYYAGFGTNATIDTELSSQKGYNSVALEFLPSQEEQVPDTSGLGFEKAMVIEPNEIRFGNQVLRPFTAEAVPLITSEGTLEKILKEIRVAPIQPPNKSVEPAEVQELTAKTPATSQKASHQELTSAAKVVHRTANNSKQQENSSDQKTAKVGPTQDRVLGQFGSFASPPGTPDGSASFDNTIPAPSYPDALRKNRVEGTVLVEIRVATDGRFKEFRIKQSSGQPLFDAAVMNSVQRASRAKPAIKDGVPIETVEVIPFVFQLKK